MKALVTGGGGFLGRRIVELLLERGYEVTIFARGRYPEVEALGASAVQGDIQDAEAIRSAAEGMDVIFHVASLQILWGDLEHFRAINVGGTVNVIEAARAQGVPKLIYTSTPSVVGGGNIVNGAHDLPYGERFGSPYPQSKAEAERLVRAANGEDLLTVSLRPRLVFGPRDTHFLPRILDRARAGKLPLVGDGKNVVDMTYIDNAAWAHLDALDALTGPDAPCAGNAYFITNDEPVTAWEFLNDFLARMDAPQVTRQVSLSTARAIGWVFETLWTYLPLGGEPRLTPYMVENMARSCWFDQTAAKRDLGYRIRVPMDEAIARTIAYYREQEAGSRAA